MIAKQVKNHVFKIIRTQSHAISCYWLYVCGMKSGIKNTTYGRMHKISSSHTVIVPGNARQ